MNMYSRRYKPIIDQRQKYQPTYKKYKESKKETTATCAIIEGTVGDESLKEFAKTIMDDLYKERPNAV